MKVKQKSFIMPWSWSCSFISPHTDLWDYKEEQKQKKKQKRKREEEQLGLENKKQAKETGVERGSCVRYTDTGLKKLD